MNCLLEKAGLNGVGGTPLFTLVRDERAKALFDHLGRLGILVRIFDERPHDIRFGLPGNDAEWQRLQAALLSFDHPSKV
jgi:cobalamin biosynthetic protein CobC